MKHLVIILTILTLFISCKNEKPQSVQGYHLSKSTTNSEESLNIIETSREFELKHNDLFQQDLQIKSKVYYDILIETFIEKETGFFKLFSELWDKPFKSKNEIKSLWKLKIERYFRTTAYLTYIRNEVNIYTDGVNNQRNNGISKILGAKYYSNLKLPIADANSFNTKSESIEIIISKINDETTDQLADIVAGFLPEIILGVLALIFVKFKGFKLPWSIQVLFIILFGGIFFWRSHNRQNEIRNILKTECNKALKSTKIDYLDQLNKNTIEYYSQLQKINYETNK